MATSKKRRNSKKQTVAIPKHTLYIGAVLVAVILIGAGFILTSDGQPAATAIASNITPDDYVGEFDERDHILIDVRTPQEFASGHIEGAINIPVQELQARIDEVPEGVPVVLYCRSGNRSTQASRILQNNDYQSGIYDLGGILDWTAAGYPVE